MSVGPPKDVFTTVVPGSPSVGPPLDVFAEPNGSGGGGGGTGTVTSIDVSGGTTGLSTTGGPVTVAGVITLHLLNAVQLSGRNALDNADVGLIGVNASDQITLSDFGLMDPVIKSLTITSTTNAVDRGLVSYEASPSDLGSMFVGKRAGGSPGSPSIVPANTAIANYAALAYDGVSWLRTGIMQFGADSPTAVNSIPTSWELYLSDGSTDAIGTTPKITVTVDGNVSISSAASGVTLEVGALAYPDTDSTAGYVVTTDGAGTLSLQPSTGGSAALTDTQIGFGSALNALTGDPSHTWQNSTGLETLSGVLPSIQLLNGDGHAAILSRDTSNDTLTLSNGSVAGYSDQYSFSLASGAIYTQDNVGGSFTRYVFGGGSAFSVVIAFNPTTVDATDRGIATSGQNTGWNIRYNSTRTLFYSADTVHTSTSANNVAGAALVAGQMNLIICTFANVAGTITRTIYVNNVSATSSQAGGPLTYNGGDGLWVGWANDVFNGSTGAISLPNIAAGNYDNFTGYDRALTSGEATAYWNGGSLQPLSDVPQDFTWRFRFDNTTGWSGTSGYPFTDDIFGGSVMGYNSGRHAITGGTTLGTAQTPLFPVSDWIPTASRTVFKHTENPTGNPTLQLGDSATVLSILPTTGTSVGAAGGASALPATPLGYIPILVNGTSVKIPYYNP